MGQKRTVKPKKERQKKSENKLAGKKSSESAKKAAAIGAEVIDEIDKILEETGEDFAIKYYQRGGE